VTDLETLKTMLTRANIEFEEYEAYRDKWDRDIDHSIIVERGYPYFYTVFSFNPDGSLKDMGAYE